MIKHTDTLSMVEFHAYVDSQLTDRQYEQIETRLVDSPETIVSLQNCLLINEKLQICFNGPEIELDAETEAEYELETEAVTTDTQTNPYQSSNHLEYIPPEPTLSNIPQQELDLDTQDSYTDIDSLELHQEAQLETDAEINTILPARDNEDTFIPELNVPQLELPQSEITEPELAAAEIPELNIPELTLQDSAEETADLIPPVLTASAYNETMLEAEPEADIDVDDFLKGINETHMVDNTVSPMSHESLGKDIFAVSQPFASSSGLLAKLKATTINLLLKIKQRRKSRSGQQQALGIENDTDATIDNFEIDINEAIDSTPKLRFWRFRMQHVADDALDSVKEQLEPMAPTVSPWLSKTNAIFSSVNTTLRKISFIDKTLNRSYWILGGITLGVFLGAWLFSSSGGLNKNDIQTLAMDTHLYFLEQGANVAEGGIDDFEKNMKWLQQHWGQRVTSFNVSETKFRIKGATLLPTPNNYASVQIFENFNNERITVYVSKVIGEPENSRIRCHITEKIDGVCNWTRGTLSYFVLGNLSLSRVRHFSSLIASQL